MTLQPGEVPTDESLEMEASQLDTELDKKTQAKFDKAKKDGLDLSSLQKMSGQELIKVAEKQKIQDPANLSKQKLVFEILKSRAEKQARVRVELTERWSVGRRPSNGRGGRVSPWRKRTASPVAASSAGAPAASGIGRRGREAIAGRR